MLGLICAGLTCIMLTCIIVIQLRWISYLKRQTKNLALKERLLTQIIQERCIPYYNGKKHPCEAKDISTEMSIEPDQKGGRIT